MAYQGNNPLSKPMLVYCIIPYIIYMCICIYVCMYICMYIYMMRVSWPQCIKSYGTYQQTRRLLPTFFDSNVISELLFDIIYMYIALSSEITMNWKVTSDQRKCIRYRRKVCFTWSGDADYMAYFMPLLCIQQPFFITCTTLCRSTGFY